MATPAAIIALTVLTCPAMITIIVIIATGITTI